MITASGIEKLAQVIRINTIFCSLSDHGSEHVGMMHPDLQNMFGFLRVLQGLEKPGSLAGSFFSY